MSKFLHDAMEDDKATAIPLVFSENSHAIKGAKLCQKYFNAKLLLCYCSPFDIEYN